MSFQRWPILRSVWRCSSVIPWKRSAMSRAPPRTTTAASGRLAPAKARVADTVVFRRVRGASARFSPLPSELAAEANVARGTLYRYVDSMDELFDKVVASFSADLHQRVADSFEAIEDPATRLATGVRMWIRYAQENPEMGRFAVRFGQTAETLRAVLTGPTMDDLENGFRSGRFPVDEALAPNVAALIIGTTISAMWMVLEGHQTWREAGTSTSELVLRALGIEAKEAHRIATEPLPALQPFA